MNKPKKQSQCSSYDNLILTIEKMLNTDHNSVSSQLIFATKHLRISKIIEWCSSQEKSCFRNPDLKLFSELGFISTHSICVRGLAFGSQPHEMSLKNISRLLKDNQRLISRKNYVSNGKIPYDYENPLEVEFGKLSETLEPFQCAVKDISPADRSRQRHMKFDTLSNTDANKRHANDLISDAFFNKIHSELNNCASTNKFANLCVAHRQLEKVRQKHETENTKIILSIEELEKNYISLWKVFNTLNYYFFDAGHDPILSMTHQFSELDSPMIGSEKVIEYKRFMESLEKQDRLNYNGIIG